MQLTRPALCLVLLAVSGCADVPGNRSHTLLSTAVSTTPESRDQPSGATATEEPCSRETTVLPQIGKKEAENIAQSGGLASRRGRVLQLRLENGKTTQIVDVAPSACMGPGRDVGKCRDYEYVTHLPEARAFLVELSYWEGGSYLLVDTRTGKRTEIVGVPRFSPDGKRFVAIFNSNYAVDNYEVWSLSPTGPKRETKGIWPLVDYCFVRWDGNERVKLRLEDEEFALDGRALTAEMYLTRDGWEKRYIRGSAAPQDGTGQAQAPSQH